MSNAGSSSADAHHQHPSHQHQHHHSPHNPIPDADSPTFVPIADLVFERGGRAFRYDECFVLAGMGKRSELNGRVARVCSPGNNGRVKVQVLVSGTIEHVKPSRLLALDARARARLPADERAQLMIIEQTSASIIGADVASGHVLYKT
jgi:hypothetical protein